jgi:4,5-dihydroxyphthalate decarboxylase
VAVKLYDAFLAAKARATETLLENIPAALVFGPEYLAMTSEILGNDPFPYGIKANRAMLETLIDFSHEQGLTPRKMTIDELFAKETLDL